MSAKDWAEAHAGLAVTDSCGLAGVVVGWIGERVVVGVDGMGIMSESERAMFNALVDPARHGYTRYQSELMLIDLTPAPPVVNAAQAGSVITVYVNQPPAMSRAEQARYCGLTVAQLERELEVIE